MTIASKPTDWTAFPETGTATADNTGPFPFRAFLETAFRHLHDPGEDLITVTDGGGAVALAASERGVRFVGPEHVTDYHSPIGVRPATALVEAFGSRSGESFRFDSMPEQAVAAVGSALDTVGASFTTQEGEVAAVLDLPGAYEDWLMGIGKKERHEVRRKRRRFEATFGEATLQSGGVEELPAFAEMHRCSPGDKGSFMTGEMQAFFADLITDVGAVIHTLTCDGRVLAAAFGFETDDGYFYYNSAFEPDAASASPGVVLLSMLVEHEIERGVNVFDFLKGDEQYKFRHGARRRQLYTLEGTFT